MEVRIDLVPEVLDVAVQADVRRELGVGIAIGFLARALERAADQVDPPIRRRVRGVVEHLSDDLAPQATVRPPLDFDERRHAGLV
jgi:hypothetical protein